MLGFSLYNWVGLGWVWIIPILLNGNKWVIGFLISNPFKTQQNPPICYPFLTNFHWGTNTVHLLTQKIWVIHAMQLPSTFPF